MRTESLAAIDVHVHIEVDAHGHHSMDDEPLAASANHFKAGHDRTPTLEQIADLYRTLNMAAVVFTVDAATATGRVPAAVAQAPSLVSEYAVSGFKFQPTLQGFAPTDQAFSPLWAQIA